MYQDKFRIFRNLQLLNTCPEVNFKEKCILKKTCQLTRIKYFFYIESKKCKQKSDWRGYAGLPQVGFN